MTGDHFVLFPDEDGLWYWQLWKAHQPTAHPIAKGGTGYDTATSALDAIRSAREAMAGAFVDGEPRVDRLEGPP